MVEAEAQPDAPDSPDDAVRTAGAADPVDPVDVPRHARWRSGLGCAGALLSVLVLVLVGEYSGLLLHHDRGTSGAASAAPSSSAGSDLRSLLGRLPDTAQPVPETAEGVAQLLAELHIPAGTPTQTEITGGDILVALGRTGDCVFLDVHHGRLTAWLPSSGASCTTGAAAAEARSHS